MNSFKWVVEGGIRSRFIHNIMMETETFFKLKVKHLKRI